MHESEKVGSLSGLEMELSVIGSGKMRCCTFGRGLFDAIAQ